MRKERGVTLIALVITIIVLIILAGVTITAVVGDDQKGLLGRTKSAKEKATEDISERDEFLSDYNDEEMQTNEDNLETSKAKTGTVNFYNGTTLLASVKVEAGMSAKYPMGLPEPTKEADSNGSYTFNGKWSTSNGGNNVANLNNIQANVLQNVYAMYDVKKIISFTICDKVFYAEEGMTFGEWVNNPTYNTCNAVVSDYLGVIWIPETEWKTWNKDCISCFGSPHASGGCFLNYGGYLELTDEIIQDMWLVIGCGEEGDFGFGEDDIF